MNIIDKNMGGRGGLGGSVSRWNFEAKVKNATLRSVKKKHRPSRVIINLKLKKNTYTLAQTEAECHRFSRAPIPPRSHPLISER